MTVRGLALAIVLAGCSGTPPATVDGGPRACTSPAECTLDPAPGSPYLLGVCDDTDHCAVLDLHEHPSTQCTRDRECTVRYASCCGCSGTPDQVIGTRGDALVIVDTLLCEGGACSDACVMPTITTHEARCVAGRCEAIPLP